MHWKDKVGEAVVGGLAGLAVVVLFLIAQALLYGATPGDWLAFAGAMIGIGGATGTAIYAADRSRRAARRDDVNLLRGAMHDLDGTLAKIARGDAGEQDKAKQKDSIVLLLTQLEFGREVFAHALTTSRIDDVTLWRHVRLIEKSIADNAKMIARETAIVGKNEPTDDILRIYREHTKAFAGELRPLLRSAIERIDRL
ncbi:MAG: hypothetical protein IBJ13_02820 [Sphingopyxis sp.]|nr:hypothetical protein [Sphingopyxis sp.]